MIGIFIGSFNPPTLAHLDICLKLQNKFKQIVFVPVNTKDKYVVSIQDRIKMLNLYMHKYSFLKIDDIMINYSYLNYRIIDILKKKYGSITLIIGSDLLKKIDTFDNYLYLISKYSFMVVKRNNDNIEDIIKKKYSNISHNITILNYSNNISSSLARELIQKKKDTSGVLDDEITKYIIDKRFYV